MGLLKRIVVVGVIFYSVIFIITSVICLNMKITILDCYTDEASGLGVPPYLGTYPRYLYGKFSSSGDKVNYLTIDDLRLWKQLKNVKKETEEHQKTNIFVHNLTKNSAEKVLGKTDLLIVILGVHVPGKYLTAVPGTLKEVVPMLKDINCDKILTGPAVFGTQLEGGKFFEKEDVSVLKLESYYINNDGTVGNTHSDTRGQHLLMHLYRHKYICIYYVYR